ncbi:glycosyltransferase family 4 protein [Mycobacterium sp. M26]|uniref:glycosyltransferase family 4 protein n=1 Tax=Mycobacterium sp. M26 TaxID=1762962 RepID=UPI0018D233A2|nr:glycosyltransferase family 4 protein [Mycobacterium sp. M26]
MFATQGSGRRDPQESASTNCSAKNRPEQIVVVSNVSSFGGGGVVGFREILLGIRRMRPDAGLLAVLPRHGDVAEDCTRRGIPTKISWVPWWAFGKWWQVPRIDPHAVVGWVPYVTFLVPGIVQAVLLLRRLHATLVLSNTMTIPSHAIAAKLLGIPHYWIVREFGRDDHGFWFLFGYRRTIRWIGRLSETVICNSFAVQKALLAIDSTMKTAVVHPVIETPLRTPSERGAGERMRTVLVGYFSPGKGQHLAIEAVAIARKAGVDIELTLVGTGRHKPLQMLARRLGVGDLLTVHGPSSDLGPYWSAAHVGLMCSQSEAFGRVTVEAMRAGLPVCGTDSGGTPEIIEHMVNGLLSPAGDAAALAANLMMLHSDENLRRKLAVGAVESSQRFGRDRHDDELIGILGLY